MRVEINNAAITFTWPSQRARGKVGCAKMNLVPGMSDGLIQKVTSSMISLCNGMSISAIKAFMSSLREIFNKLTRDFGRWPTAEEWPLAIYNIYEYQILEGRKTRLVRSSRKCWFDIRQVLERFMSIGLVPKIRLPGKARKNKKNRSDPSECEVLGESHVSIPPLPFTGAAFPKCYLRDFNYGKDDDEFFADMQAELQSASDMVFGLCRFYWKDMLRGHQAGRHIIDSVSRADLLKAMDDPKWQDGSHRAKRHIAHPGTRQGLAYFLGAIEYHFFEARTISRISFEQANNIPFLKVLAGKSWRNRSAFFTRLAIELDSKDIPGNNFCKALGILTTRDCAAAAAILIHEQPRFTPQSLERADAYDSNGKLLVSVLAEAASFADVDGETEIFEFTIAKERAKARKGGMMTPIGSKVLSDLERATRHLRLKAQYEQPDVARKLFLVATEMGFGHVGRIGTYFNAPDELSVYNWMSVQLSSASFTHQNFTLSKVRNTEGILIWLKTGSASAMAASMGNSVKCVLECYIPDWVYRRMLIRTARRLQQKLIVLSTADSPWMLPASDFVTHEELQDFVVKMLAADNKGNPLSRAFSKAFAKGESTNDSDGTSGGELYISLRPESVAALEVFVMSGFSSLVEKPGTARTASAIKLYHLYDLIYAAVHADSHDEADSMILDLISGGSRAQLRMVWRKSRELISNFQSRLKKSDGEVE